MYVHAGHGMNQRCIADRFCWPWLIRQNKVFKYLRNNGAYYKAAKK